MRQDSSSYSNYLVLSKRYLNLKEIYKVRGRNFTYYHVDILYEWRKEKYDFVIKYDLKK